MRNTIPWTLLLSCALLALPHEGFAQTAGKKTPPAARSKSKATASGTKGKSATPTASSKQTDGIPAKPTAPPANVIEKLSKDQRAIEVKKMRATYKKFRQAAKEYLGEVRALVRKRYRERRNLIAGGYEARIKVLEKRETLKRKSAIAYFKAFIQKYPNNPKYSPDAMYRLAELIYEKEYEEYLARAGRYEEDLKRFENKEISDEPLPAKKQFTETVAWLQKLTTQFPRYRLLANAYYLLGYCRGEEENTNEALAYFRKIPELAELKKQDPATYKSLSVPNNLVAEAWVRLGEFYFRTNQRQNAKQAYLNVLKYPKIKIFDKALYKLAWTHYLLDEFQPAIDRFTQLLEYYIAKKKKGSGAVLRQEAIEYIAISYADERWGSLDKAVQFVRKVGLKKPYSRDVLLQLSKNYGIQGKWTKVIATNERILELFPNHPENPLVQQQTVIAWRRLGDLNKAMLARGQLSKRFGPGSQWARINEKNLRVQRMVQKLISNNIYRTAVYNHLRCETLRKEADKSKEDKDKLLAAAKISCTTAADNYSAFLKKFPHHKEAYKLTWYLADSLYFIKRYNEASIYFKKIRDWTGEKKYQQEAAFSLVDSYIRLVNKDCKRGIVRLACELPSVRKKEQAKADKAAKKKKRRRTTHRRKQIKAIPITNPNQKELVKAREYYIKKYFKTKDERIPEQLYLLARIYYKYDQLETARKLLKRFIETYPKHKYVKYAGETIIASYYREGRDDDMLAAMDWLRKYNVSVKDAGLIRLGVAFRKAERLEKKGKYGPAAKAYVEIINKNPKIPKAAEALWNAAYLFTRAQRFGSAIKLYERIVRQYPTWDKADQALFNVAYNAEKYFLFEKALARYRKLVNDSNFRKSKHRADALYNVALLQLNLQRYDDAARTYVRYSNTFRDREDVPEMLYKAAMIYKRMNRREDMLRILRLFIRRYERNSAQVRRVMTAYGQILESKEKEGLSRRRMEREYKKIIRVFERLSSNMKPADIVQTRKYPAKASYKLAMYKYAKFEKLTVTSKNPKRQVRQRNKKAKEYDKVAGEFSKISTYKSPPWLLCAMFRIAEGKQKIAEAINKAPLPRLGFKWTEEAKDIYKQKIDEQLIQPLEQAAKKLYRKVITVSTKLNYKNNCVEQSYEALHRADPTFPLPKKSTPSYNMEPTSPLPLLRSLQSGKKKKKSSKKRDKLKAPAPRPKVSAPAPRPKVTAPAPR